MTPSQISVAALQIAGERALSTSQSQMNLTITCADATIASALHHDLETARLQATPHRNNANVVVVQLRPRQQIIIRKHVTSHYIGRFHGERGER